MAVGIRLSNNSSASNLLRDFKNAFYAGIDIRHYIIYPV